MLTTRKSVRQDFHVPCKNSVSPKLGPRRPHNGELIARGSFAVQRTVFIGCSVLETYDFSYELYYLVKCSASSELRWRSNFSPLHLMRLQLLSRALFAGRTKPLRTLSRTASLGSLSFCAWNMMRWGKMLSPAARLMTAPDYQD